HPARAERLLAATADQGYAVGEAGGLSLVAVGRESAIVGPPAIFGAESPMTAHIGSAARKTFENFDRRIIGIARRLAPNYISHCKYPLIGPSGFGGPNFLG